MVILQRIGCRLLRHSSGADGGVDLILHREGQTALVQCKQWKTWKVGVKIVRELYGVMAAQKAARGVVVVCGRFTREDKAFAEGKPLELVDGPVLCNLVEAVRAGAEPTRMDPRQVTERTASKPHDLNIPAGSENG